jgi:hypothetical protein
MLFQLYCGCQVLLMEETKCAEHRETHWPNNNLNYYKKLYQVHFVIYENIIIPYYQWGSDCCLMTKVQIFS